MTDQTDRLCAEDGFTMVEMLIAAGITMAVTAATFTLMNPAQGMFAAQPELMEMQQRLRIGVDALTKDLLMAGGGLYSGSITGSLGHYLAPILPYRIGNVSADPAGRYYTDRITMMYVPQTAAQTTIADPIRSTSAEVRVTKQPGCPIGPIGPIGNDVCGFTKGTTVLIMDDTGSWDTFTVTTVLSPTLQLQHRGAALNKAYETGSHISEIAMYTYWLKTDTVAQTYQLMRYDGDRTDVPIADNVVGLAFEYFGEPAPPQLRPGVAPIATYGPSPPALGLDNPADAWGAGENCAFTRSADAHLPRLDSLGGGNSGLVKLTQAQLTDGPWCPDAISAGRYDADLLRVRKVRVTLRVQVANPAFRGPGGSLFTRGGTSRGGERYLPDQEIRFDVTPRNLSLGR